MCKVVVKVNCRHKKRIRLIPALGAFSEQTPSKTLFSSQKGKPKGDVILMFELPASQQVTCSIKPVDAKGNPAKVDGVPVWMVDNPNLLVLVPAADGMSCLVKAAGPLGSAKVSLTADADMGPGVENIFGVLDVTVTAGKAVSVDIQPGTPTEQ